MNIKFPYSKKFLKATLALALVAAPATTLIQPGQASATTLTQPIINADQGVTNGFAPAKQAVAGEGSIKVTLLNDDKTALTSEVVHVTITDKSGTLVASGDTVSGVFDSKTDTKLSGSKLAKGTFYVTASKGSLSQTTEVKGAGKNEAQAKIVWETKYDGLKDSKGAIKKSGAIAGVVYDNVTGDTAIASKVTVVSKKTQWTTYTNAEGAFKIYVPTGSYSVIVGDDNKQIYNNVKVSAGQTSSPLEQLNGGATFNDTTKKLGYELTTTAANIKLPATTKLAGKANMNSIVTVYTVTASGDTVDVDGNTVSADTATYTWAGEAAVKGKKTDATGTFSISVKKNALAGQTIVFVVTDAAGNVYEDSTPYTVDKIDAPALSASAAKGTTPDTTAIKVTPKTAGNTITLQVGTGRTGLPKVGNLAPTTNDSAGVVITNYNYTSKADVKAKAGDKVDVYEVNGKGEVVLFKQITLTATNVK